MNLEPNKMCLLLSLELDVGKCKADSPNAKSRQQTNEFTNKKYSPQRQRPQHMFRIEAEIAFTFYLQFSKLFSPFQIRQNRQNLTKIVTTCCR